jgi:hypothetical protein
MGDKIEKLEEISKILSEKNSLNYNILKACEEFTELQEVLIKSLTKPNNDFKQKIIEEIGDCYIRLNILIKMFNEDDVKSRIEFKLTKFENYIKENKFINI